MAAKAKPPISLVEFVQIWALQQGFGSIPRMHREFAAFLEDTIPDPHRLLMAYRHSSKSTIISLYVCWRLALDCNLSFLVISAGTELARRNTSFMRGVIETHPFCTHLIPDAEEWRADRFNVKRKAKRLDASVTCTSIRSKMTGKHADELICDDVEVAENVVTEEGRENIRRAVEKLFSMGTRFLICGTPHDEDTIYEKLENDAGLGFITRKWPVRKPDGSPQAPDFLQNGTYHDNEWIRTKELGATGTYRSQFLLIPARAYETLFDLDAIREFNDEVFIDDVIRDERPNHLSTPSFWIDGKRIKSLAAYWDVASGLQARDNSVIAVAAKTEGNDVYLLAAVALPPVDPNGEGLFVPQMDKLFDVLSRHHCTTVHVEKTGMGFAVPDALRQHAKKKGRKIRVKEANRDGRSTKKVFIAETIEPLIKIGKLYVSADLAARRHPFMVEMASFPNGKKDDHIDATAGAINELIPSRTGDVGKLKGLADRPFSVGAKAAVVNEFR